MTPAMKQELLAAGYRHVDNAVCPKCGTPVEQWVNDNGTKLTWNTEEHPTGAGVSHHFTCGEKYEGILD